MSAIPSCPDAGDLVAWLDGALEPAELARVRHHVESCAPCRRAAEDLRARSAAVSAWLARADVPPPRRDAYDLRPRGGAHGDRDRRSGWRVRWGIAAGIVLAVAVGAGPARGWLLERLGLEPDRPASTAPEAGLTERASTSFVPLGSEITLAFTAGVSERTLVVRRSPDARATLSAPHPDPELLVGPGGVEILGAAGAGEYHLAVPAGIERVRIRVAGAPDRVVEVGAADRTVAVPSGGG
jgi:hypothetical protein